MLRARALDASYGPLRALFAVDLEVAPGETVALIGAGGAGKSTLLKALAGALAVPRDALSLDGALIGASSERRQLARGIALIQQGHRLFATLTVLENFQLAVQDGRAGPWTLERVLDELPSLKGLVHRIASSLSTGQRQLVLIARALLSNPDYLLCDDISQGLSQAAADDMYQLLGTVRCGGTAIVLVEQDVERALAESDRYYCLQQGHVVLSGVSARADRPALARAYHGALS